MAKFLLYGLFFFLGVTLSCPAQTADTPTPPRLAYLLLAKPGKLPRFRFYKGDRITFRVKNDTYFYSGPITDIKDGAFYFQQSRIPLEWVAEIKMKNHTSGRKAVGFLSYLLQGTGALFTLVGGINYFATPDYRDDAKFTMGAALSTFAVGKAMTLSQKRKYEINKKWQLKVIEMY
ncbi:hypothetical protein [Rufibacter ruber]|uniref:hypothetical protein n=1 Tax=Rufibacter ruber TaxID=1783499 RepID=UPI000834A313|nr:hypothetical protein [Rufibacter ruber]